MLPSATSQLLASAPEVPVARQNHTACQSPRKPALSHLTTSLPQLLGCPQPASQIADTSRPASNQQPASQVCQPASLPARASQQASQPASSLQSYMQGPAAEGMPLIRMYICIFIHVYIWLILVRTLRATSRESKTGVFRDGPRRAESSRAGPGRGEPRRADRSRAELSRAEPSWAEPGQARPSQAGPSRAYNVRYPPNRKVLPLKLPCPCEGRV